MQPPIHLAHFRWRLALGPHALSLLATALVGCYDETQTVADCDGGALIDDAHSPTDEAVTDARSDSDADDDSDITTQDTNAPDQRAIDTPERTGNDTRAPDTSDTFTDASTRSDANTSSPLPSGPGFIFGDVRGVDKVSLANNGSQSRRAVIITSERLYDAPSNPDPGPQGTLDGNGSYRIVSRLGDVAVVALCGVYDASTDAFTPLFFDMQRFVFVTEASEQRVDLDCDKPMNLNATVKLVGAPIGAGTDINAVFPILNIGPEGYLAQPWRSEQSASDYFVFPNLIPLAGELQAMSYMIQGVSVAASGGYPQSFITLNDQRDFSAPIVMGPMMPIPRMVTPLDNATLQGGHVEWDIDNRDSIDMYAVYLFKPAFPQAQLIWQIFLPGSATSFDLPQFTGLPGAPPLHSGQTYMLIQAIKMNADSFSFDDFTWRDLSSTSHRSWSDSLVTFEMP